MKSSLFPAKDLVLQIEPFEMSYMGGLLKMDLPSLKVQLNKSLKSIF